MKHEREVAGIRCGEVLERMPLLLDGDAPADIVAKIEGHLRQCSNCAQFAVDYQSLLKVLAATPKDKSTASRSSKEWSRRITDAIEGGTERG